MVDCGAPYFTIGYAELEALKLTVLQNWNGVLGDIPDAVAIRPYWQYGPDEHASDVRVVVGSVLLCVTADDGTIVAVRHVILAASSKWVIGRIVMRFGDICSFEKKHVVLYGENGSACKLSMVCQKMHDYLPVSAFSGTSSVNNCITSACISPLSLTASSSQPAAIVTKKHPILASNTIGRTDSNHQAIRDLKGRP